MAVWKYLANPWAISCGSDVTLLSVSRDPMLGFLVDVEMADLRAFHNLPESFYWHWLHVNNIHVWTCKWDWRSLYALHSRSACVFCALLWWKSRLRINTRISLVSHGRVDARTLLVSSGTCWSITFPSVVENAFQASSTVKEVSISSHEEVCKSALKFSDE